MEGSKRKIWKWRYWVFSGQRIASIFLPFHLWFKRKNFVNFSSFLISFTELFFFSFLYLLSFVCVYLATYCDFVSLAPDLISCFFFRRLLNSCLWRRFCFPKCCRLKGRRGTFGAVQLDTPYSIIDMQVYIQLLYKKTRYTEAHLIAGSLKKNRVIKKRFREKERKSFSKG